MIEMNKCNYEQIGINAEYGYNQENLYNEYNEKNKEIGEKLLSDIRCLQFAITDIGEYLNTHPDDEKAICLHREYCQRLRDLSNKYQKIYGPLTIEFPCNKWRWIEEPWPWEGSEI